MSDRSMAAVATSVYGSTEKDPESLYSKLRSLDALPVTEHSRIYEEVLAQLATELDSGEPVD